MALDSRQPLWVNNGSSSELECFHVVDIFWYVYVIDIGLGFSDIASAFNDKISSKELKVSSQTCRVDQ